MKELFQDALAVMQGVFQDASVAVVYGSFSGTGLRMSSRQQAELVAEGNMDPRDSAVFVNADSIGDVTTNSAITVGGVECSVTDTGLDMVRAMRRVNYRQLRPA